MELSVIKRAYNRCKPGESLGPDDERNLDIDRFGERSPRGINWAERLARPILLSDEPTMTLFTGLPGSGKSTELRRLVAQLRAAEHKLLPVLIDAEEALDLSSPIDIPDIIAVIVQQVERAVLTAEGGAPSGALQDGYMTRLWTWLQRTDIELKGVKFSIPDGPSLTAEMKTRPSLRERVRETIAQHLLSFLKEARDELRLLEARAKRAGWSGLVVIVDSLEKLRGTSGSWHEVLQSAERVFTNGAIYLELPVHTLYTVPPALASRRIDAVQFMPMIRLYERGNSAARYEPGYAAARALIERRVERRVLAQALGEGALEARIDTLIQLSGGYPRELVRMLQSLFAASSFPVEEETFKRIGNEVRDAYRRVVPEEAFAWLAQVKRDHYMTIETEGGRAMADQMLSNNVILRYLNGSEWFDLHPAVGEIPGVIKAFKTLQQGA